MKLKTFVLLVVAGLFVLGFTASSGAQEPQGGPEGGPRRPNGMPGRGGMDGLGPAMNVLTEEQRVSFSHAMRAQREKMREIEPKLRAARSELLLAGLNGKFDETTIRKQAQTVANLETEMSIARARALSEIQPPLSAEQIEKIKSALAEGPGPGPRPPEQNPAAPRRILQNSNRENANRDENGLPPKQ